MPSGRDFRYGSIFDRIYDRSLPSDVRFDQEWASNFEGLKPSLKQLRHCKNNQAHEPADDGAVDTDELQLVGWVERPVPRSSTSEGGSDTHHFSANSDGFTKGSTHHTQLCRV
jgi:hypothetical protein